MVLQTECSDYPLPSRRSLSVFISYQPGQNSRNQVKFGSTNKCVLLSSSFKIFAWFIMRLVKSSLLFSGSQYWILGPKIGLFGENRSYLMCHRFTEVSLDWTFWRHRVETSLKLSCLHFSPNLSTLLTRRRRRQRWRRRSRPLSWSRFRFPCKWSPSTKIKKPGTFLVPFYKRPI